jgi:transposase-like protein
MPERDWSAFACPNPDCPAYGQRGQGNLRLHGWSSKARNIRCLRCTTCGHHFSERAGTPLFRTHLPEDKALAIAQHLAEGTGMRPTSLLTGVSLNTVLRFAAGPAARPRVSRPAGAARRGQPGTGGWGVGPLNPRGRRPPARPR